MLGKKKMVLENVAQKKVLIKKKRPNFGPKTCWSNKKFAKKKLGPQICFVKMKFWFHK